MKEVKEQEEITALGQKRRTFLKTAGAGMIVTALVAAGCKKKTDDPAPSGQDYDPSYRDLGAGNVGILNYAYALEQLEAGFYTTVVANAAFTTAFPDATEQQMLRDIRAHEIIHREFFKAAIPASVRISDSLMPNFSGIDFTSRSSVLAAAKTFEDLGVSAYNGAGKWITADATGLVYLGLAGKIVSVEARHASAIRDIINPNSKDFAGDDVVNSSSGLDGAKSFYDVITSANNYLAIGSKVRGTNLPK